MFVYDIDESRLTWDDMIRFYGDPAILRMPGKGDRFCSTMQASFTPEERLGRISNPADRKMLISSLDPFTGAVLDDIDEREMLVTILMDDDTGLPVKDSNGKLVEDERLRQVAPPDRIGPRRRQLYWSLAVRA